MIVHRCARCLYALFSDDVLLVTCSVVGALFQVPNQPIHFPVSFHLCVQECTVGTYSTEEFELKK